MGKAFLGPEPATKTVSLYRPDLLAFMDVTLLGHVFRIVIQLSPGSVFSRIGSRIPSKKGQKSPHPVYVKIIASDVTRITSRLSRPEWPARDNSLPFADRNQVIRWLRRILLRDPCRPD